MERKATRRGRGEEAVFCALLLAAVAAAPAAARPPRPLPWESGTNAPTAGGRWATSRTWREPIRKPGLGLRKPKSENRNSKLENRQSPISNGQFFGGRYMLRTAKTEKRKPKNENRQSTIVNHQFPGGPELAAHGPTPRLILAPAPSYSTYLGGLGFDVATDVAVGSTGSVYVTGYTNSAGFPPASVTRIGPGGGSCGSGADVYPCFDAFVAKLDPTGSRLEYVTYFGGSGDDYATGIAVDGYGNAYVTGFTNSADWPTAHAPQASPGGGLCGNANPEPCFDAFVAKLDATGATLLYSTYLGGSADDYGQGIAVDSAESVVVTGFTASADFPTTGTLQSVHAGPYDAFVTKLEPAGSSLVYSTYWGGSGDDYGTSIALDPAGNAYATGYTNSPDFPTASALQPTDGGGTCGTPPSIEACFDAYVVKVNADGSQLIYSTYLGGSGGDYGRGLAVDASGNAYVTGLTTSTDFPVTAGALQIAGGGTSVDAFVTKLDPTGSSVVYSTYLGGSGAEAGFDIAVDTAGNAYLAGYAYGNGLPLAGPIQAANGGYYDAFLAMLNAAGSALVFSTYLGGSGNEEARGVALDPSGNAYLAGRTFSTDFPVTPGAFQTSYGSGAFDGFVAKLTNPALPVLRLSETSITFPAQGVDTSSPPQVLTLTNPGTVSASITSIQASSDFSQTNTCGPSLPPGAACSLSVVFAPTLRGTRTGTITVASNAADSPQVVSLSGIGIAPAVSLSAPALTFGEHVVSTTSPALPVTLSNTGELPLEISSITASGDFAQTNACGANIAVGANCTISITFMPATPGLRSGTLVIADSAPDGPHTVALSGTGTDFSLSVSPATATINAGQSATYTLAVLPSAGFNQAVSLACSGAPQAATCEISSALMTADGSNATQASVTVLTTARMSVTPRPPRRFSAPDRRSLPWPLFLLCSLLILAMLVSTLLRPRRPVWITIGALLFLAFWWTACGGGGGSAPRLPSGTPPGTYTLTLTGTYSTVVRTTSVTLTVK
jgi:hypothetical protein